jgi:hypothetical protein
MFFIFIEEVVTHEKKCLASGDIHVNRWVIICINFSAGDRKGSGGNQNSC